MDKHEWISMGIRNGWVTAPLCSTHDGLGMTQAEVDEFDEGHDPCVFVLRLTDEDSTIEQIEEAASEAVMRRKNWGIEWN